MGRVFLVCLILAVADHATANPDVPSTLAAIKQSMNLTQSAQVFDIQRNIIRLMKDSTNHLATSAQLFSSSIEGLEPTAIPVPPPRVKRSAGTEAKSNKEAVKMTDTSKVDPADIEKGVNHILQNADNHMVDVQTIFGRTAVDKSTRPPGFPLMPKDHPRAKITTEREGHGISAMQQTLMKNLARVERQAPNPPGPAKSKQAESLDTIRQIMIKMQRNTQHVLELIDMFGTTVRSIDGMVANLGSNRPRQKRSLGMLGALMGGGGGGGGGSDGLSALLGGAGGGGGGGGGLSALLGGAGGGGGSAPFSFSEALGRLSGPLEREKENVRRGFLDALHEMGIRTKLHDEKNDYTTPSTTTTTTTMMTFTSTLPLRAKEEVDTRVRDDVEGSFEQDEAPSRRRGRRRKGRRRGSRRGRRGRGGRASGEELRSGERLRQEQMRAEEA